MRAINSVSATLPTLASSTQSCIYQTQSFYTNGGAAPSVGITYNNLGNITTKSDVGTYTYPSGSQPIARPHAVQSITGAGAGSFTYDADGNMLTSSNGRTITYTSFDRVKTITLNGQTTTFYYDAEHNRIIQTNPQVNTVYMPDYEVTGAPGASSDIVHTYFNDANGQHVGEIERTGVTVQSIGTATVKFYLNDWQSSVSVIANAAGALSEADSFDAWGKRRNLNGTPDNNDTITSQSIHGYTNQEELQDAELIDLNARMYDPFLGVMLSVDPAVADPINQQTWNAYSYASNNPMRYMDPTGMLQKCAGDCEGSAGGDGGGDGGYGPPGPGGDDGDFPWSFLDPIEGPGIEASGGGLQEIIINSGYDPCDGMCATQGGMAPGDYTIVSAPGPETAIGVALATGDSDGYIDEHVAEAINTGTTNVGGTQLYAGPGDDLYTAPELDGVAGAVEAQGGAADSVSANSGANGAVTDSSLGLDNGENGTTQSQASPVQLAQNVIFGHGDRHVGNPAAAQQEILDSLPSLENILPGSSFWGRTDNYEYRAFMLPDGTLNIGTYYDR